MRSHILPCDLFEDVLGCGFVRICSSRVADRFHRVRRGGDGTGLDGRRIGWRIGRGWALESGRWSLIARDLRIVR
jgi:hypothetical protein